jgi:hypothetical protein
MSNVRPQNSPYAFTHQPKGALVIHHKLRSLLLCTVVSLFISGCAAPVVRTAQEDQAIKSIAVISLLNEQTKVTRIGFTVFNNKTVVVDQAGVLNNAAVETLESSIRKARPSWTIKDTRSETPRMMTKLDAAGPSISGQVSAISSDLSELAKRLDVDLLFVVVDTRFDNSPGKGVGIQFRGRSIVYALCLIVLVDRNGNEILNRWGGESAYKHVESSDLGIDYELDTVSSAGVQEKLKSAMRERLAEALTKAAATMGY